MTVQVERLVVHYVDKKDETVDIHLRNDEMPVNDKVDIFIEQLHHAYNGKPGKGFCGFSPEKNGVVSSSIQSYRQGEMHFYHLTEKAADVLKEELNNLSFPLQFFDFETFSNAIPRFENMGSNDAVPIQFSNHILNIDGSLDHREFIQDKYSKNITISLVESPLSKTDNARM